MSSSSTSFLSTFLPFWSWAATPIEFMLVRKRQVLSKQIYWHLFVAYNTFYILGTLCSMQIPFVGFMPVRTSEHMASAGVFLLLNAYAFLRTAQKYVTRSEVKVIFFSVMVAVAGLVFLGVVVLTYAGYIAPWSGRFYSLWDTGYAKIHIPIIASVSEHQPTTWFSFFFDLHLLVPTFPIGLWYCIKHVNDERVFSKSNWGSDELSLQYTFFSSRSLRNHGILFCWSHGPSYVDTNTGGLHPECDCILRVLRILPPRRRWKEAKSRSKWKQCRLQGRKRECGKQRRSGREENQQKSLWQGLCVEHILRRGPFC